MNTNSSRANWLENQHFRRGKLKTTEISQGVVAGFWPDPCEILAGFSYIPDKFRTTGKLRTSKQCYKMIAEISVPGTCLELVH
jgi:hypothetical protein